MQIKYKLKHKETGEVITDLKGYLLDKDGNAVTAILSNNTKVDCSNYVFCRFLEKIDGKDIYHGDKAIADIALYGNDDDDWDDDEEWFKVKTERHEGTFVELYEEGCYYFVTKDNNTINYLPDSTKIIKLY